MADAATDSPPYFRRNPNYPLTAVGYPLHNVILSWAVDLGLVGATLWALALLLGVGGAFLTRGPPDLAPWKYGLLGVFAGYLVIANSIPPMLFTNLVPWILAGVVFSGRYATDQSPRVRRWRAAKAASACPSAATRAWLRSSRRRGAGACRGLVPAVTAIHPGPETR